MPGVSDFPRVVNERGPSPLGLGGKTHIGHMTRRKQLGTDQETTSLWVTFVGQEGALETAATGSPTVLTLLRTLRTPIMIAIKRHPKRR